MKHNDHLTLITDLSYDGSPSQKEDPADYIDVSELKGVRIA